MKVALVGCGNIAPHYAREMQVYPGLALQGCFDRNPERAQALASSFSCQAYPSLEALLGDPEVEVVVNLTLLPAHFEITRSALLAGKHVYSEKPLAATSQQAWELVGLAEQLGLRLGCAPITFLGTAQQRALQELQSGSLGQVRLVYAEANHGRIESWHPSPAPIYGVGPLRDVGVYPLSVVTAFLGPVQRVWAFGNTLKSRRSDLQGQPFTATAPDFQVVLLELQGGCTVRLTASFYTTHTSKQSGIEFHGDQGQLHLSSWVESGATLERAGFGEPYQPLPAVAAEPFRYALGLADLAQAIREGTPHRASAAHAAHLVEVLEAAGQAMRLGTPVEVHSTFEPPAAFAGLP